MKNRWNILSSLSRKTVIGALCLSPSLTMGMPTADDVLPMILVPHNQTIASRARVLPLDVQANIDFEMSDDADWLDVQKGPDQRIYVVVQQNMELAERRAAITFSNAEKQISQVVYITQKGDGSAFDLPEDKPRMPQTCTDNNHLGAAYELAASIDKNTTTYYSSRNCEGGVFVDPVVLTYHFAEPTNIDYVNYRCSKMVDKVGGPKDFSLYVKTKGEADFKLVEEYAYISPYGSKTISFGEGLKQVEALQMKVKSCFGTNLTCSEIEFIEKDEANREYSIFADDVYSSLREGVKWEDIENLTNPFVKSLASRMYKGTYSTDYRVGSYHCDLSNAALSKYWSSNITYDQIAGVTGINIPANSKSAVMVSGIPEGIEVLLKVGVFYEGKVGNSFDDPNRGGTYFFPHRLKNGMNIIEHNFDWDGLAYIDYKVDSDLEKYGDIKVHFINGEVNGYLSEEKTNEEMYEICRNAKNTCVDVLSNRVHAVWTAKGLSDLRGFDGKTRDYKTYMNVLDSIVTWEHRSLGLEKYKRFAANRTLCYVNYTYFMFSSGLGVSFHVDCEAPLLNLSRFIKNEIGGIWGMAHEWGHQHQMMPYFNWAGLGEVSNNVQSYYVLRKSGCNEDLHWGKTLQHYLNDTDYPGTLSKERKRAYEGRHNYSYSADLYDLCCAMKNDTISAVKDDPFKGLAYAETNESLVAFLKLVNYFYHQGYIDFTADWYESLRTNDEPNGSQIEKKGDVDKYELIASAQNNNKNNKLAVLREKYPETCWLKEGYISEQHCSPFENSVPFVFNFIRKTSRLTGYNLVPYFMQWGFLRKTALSIDDYGFKYYLMTDKMYDEFVEDMDELVRKGELKTVSEEMVNEISHAPELRFPRPNF